MSCCFSFLDFFQPCLLIKRIDKLFWLVKVLKYWFSLAFSLLIGPNVLEFTNVYILLKVFLTNNILKIFFGTGVWMGVALNSQIDWHPNSSCRIRLTSFAFLFWLMLFWVCLPVSITFFSTQARSIVLVQRFDLHRSCIWQAAIFGISLLFDFVNRLDYLFFLNIFLACLNWVTDVIFCR